MKFLLSIFFLFCQFNLNAQYSKTYDFGGLDRASNVIISDTGYYFIGKSILDWNDYLNDHGSLIILHSDIEGNIIKKSIIRNDTLSLYSSYTDVLKKTITGFDLGLSVFNYTDNFLRIGTIQLDDTFGFSAINMFAVDTFNMYFSDYINNKNSNFIYGNISFEPGISDIILIKTDRNNVQLGQFFFGGGAFSSVGKIIKLNENEFLISGSTDSGAVIRPYSTAIASNGFINKIDSNGIVIWEKKYETQGRDGPIKVYDKGYFSQTAEGKIVDFWEDYSKVYWGQIDVNTGEVLYADTISSGDNYEMDIASIEKVQELQNGDILVLSIGQNDSIYKEYADIRRYNSNKELLWHKTYKNTASGLAWLYTFQEDTLHNNELVFTGFNHSQVDTFSQDVWVLKLNADGCINASSCGLAIGMIDISPPKAVFEIETYPNPAEDKINIAIGNTSAHIGEYIQLYVFNNQGKKIFQTEEKLQGQFPVFQINIANFTKGIYFIKASVNGKEYGNGKFVKQ